jgi:hypothetical protein
MISVQAAPAPLNKWVSIATRLNFRAGVGKALFSTLSAYEVVYLGAAQGMVAGVV